jgi:competence protein ComGC
MKSKQQGFTLFELIFVLLWIAGAYGWVTNIIKLVDTVNDTVTGLFIVRAIGIFVPPLGAVMGFI